MGERLQNVVFPQEIVRDILALARLRKNPRDWEEMDTIINNNPQLSSVRVVAFFTFSPEGSSLEIGANIRSWHTDLREGVCEKGLTVRQMVSGEFFEIDGRRYLLFDKAPCDFLSDDLLQEFVSSGYTILTPEFTLYSPATK